MALAGLRQRAVRGDRVSLEQLLVRPPAVILRSDYRSGQYSGEQRWLAHPLARRVRGARTIVTDGRLWTCMGPPLAGEIERLRAPIGGADETGAARPSFLLGLRRAAGLPSLLSLLAALAADRRSARPRTGRSRSPCSGSCGCRGRCSLSPTGRCSARSGAAIQGLFANPLASPDLTGTTSGAALGAVVTAYLFGFSAPLALALGAVGGALGALLLLLALAGPRAETATLLLAGPRDQRAGGGADHARPRARPLPLRLLRRL